MRLRAITYQFVLPLVPPPPPSAGGYPYPPGRGYAGYFYNPNIHPCGEYLRREESLKKFSKTVDFKVIYEKNYDMEEFIRNVAFREENRCYYCLSKRLEKTASLAKSSKFTHFSTTLYLSFLCWFLMSWNRYCQHRL